MEKEYLIDDIMENIFDIIFGYYNSSEDNRSFNIFCNKEVKTQIDKEIIEKNNGSIYSKRIHELCKENPNADLGVKFESINGIQLHFVIDDRYKFITIGVKNKE